VFYTHNNLRFKASLAQPIYFNEVLLTPEEIGVVNGEINWKKVGGYLGFGIGRTVPNKQFGYGFDLGCYYIGKPELELNATEKLAPSNNQEDKIEENMSGYRILPYANFRISYKLSK
jgi:hypothetical protein